MGDDLDGYGGKCSERCHRSNMVKHVLMTYQDCDDAMRMECALLAMADVVVAP